MDCVVISQIIGKDNDFRESNQVYSAVCKDLKRQGFGGIDHHPPIEKADLVKMYQNFDFTNPKHLLGGDEEVRFCLYN
jgi:hypothetical protein